MLLLLFMFVVMPGSSQHPEHVQDRQANILTCLVLLLCIHVPNCVYINDVVARFGPAQRRVCFNC